MGETRGFGDGITEPQSTRRGFLKVVAASAGVAALPLATWQQSAAAAQLASEPALAVRVTPYRVGRWLPSDEAVLDRWLSDLVRKVDLKPAPLHPVVEELGNLIESDPAIYMYFHQMFGQLPDRPQFDKTPIGTRQVRDYKHMLRLISAILTTAPSFNKTGLVGFPINAILDWPTGLGNSVLALMLLRIEAAHVEAAIAALTEWTETTYVSTLAGRADVYAQIICADAEALGNILTRARSLRGVIETETMLELEVHKFTYSHANAGS